MPRDKIQEDLLVRTLELPWLFRIPFDSVNSLSGLHLGLPGVNSVVCLQRISVGYQVIREPNKTTLTELANWATSEDRSRRQAKTRDS